MKGSPVRVRASALFEPADGSARARNGEAWATCWGCGKDSRTPNPRSVPTPPHRRCSQRRQFYTTRCEQTVRQRIDPQTRESKAVNSQPETGETKASSKLDHEDGQASCRGQLEKVEGYLHRCRSAPLPGSGAPTLQRGAAAALDPSERGPSSCLPASVFPMVVSALSRGR
jgi:hypothetical protein